MNTSIKKAFGLTLILSLSTPVQAGWLDTVKNYLPSFTKQNIIMGIGIGIGAAGIGTFLLRRMLAKSNESTADLPGQTPAIQHNKVLRININGSGLSFQTNDLNIYFQERSTVSCDYEIRHDKVLPGQSLPLLTSITLYGPNRAFLLDLAVFNVQNSSGTHILRQRGISFNPQKPFELYPQCIQRNDPSRLIRWLFEQADRSQQSLT